MTRICLNLNDDIYARLKATAENEDRTMTVILERALTRYFQVEDQCDRNGSPCLSPGRIQTDAI
jgi:predicted transcriptional regulator